MLRSYPISASACPRSARLSDWEQLSHPCVLPGHSWFPTTATSHLSAECPYPATLRHCFSEIQAVIWLWWCLIPAGKSLILRLQQDSYSRYHAAGNQLLDTSLNLPRHILMY